MVAAWRSVTFATMVATLSACGRLGFDDEPSADAAVDATPNPNLVEIALRGGHACALTVDGRIACWGRNTDGQLGRGTTSAFERPAVVDLAPMARVFTGEFSTFAVDAAGGLWGWGQNNAAQLGLSTFTSAEAVPRHIPIPVPVRSVAAGQYHACAISTAGDVYCWGTDICGQVGTGTAGVMVTTPTLVTGVSHVTALGVHDTLTCAIDDTNAIKCWGSAILDAQCGPMLLTPQAPGAFTTARTVTGGCHQTICATDLTGVPACWGVQHDGNFGDGTTLDRDEPGPVTALTGIRMVATGFAVTCGAGATGVACWGSNENGALGLDASVTDSPTPVDVPDYAGLTVDQIEVGCGDSCARVGNVVKCWGANANGEVATGDTTPQFAPVPVTLPF